MDATRQPDTDGSRRAAGRDTGLRRREAALVSDYPDLVRIAHLVLSPAPERHRRVVAAHAVVQGALSGRPARTPDGDAHEEVLARVLHHALRRAGRPPRVWLPRVTGLRLFPVPAGEEEHDLERAIAGLAPPVRAAYAVREVTGRGAAAAAAILAAAGVADPEGAVTAAASFADERPGDRLVLGPHFDACTLRAAPGDLLRRLRRRRAGTLSLAAVVAAGAVAFAAAGPGPDRPRAAPAAHEPGGRPVATAAPAAPEGSTRLDFGAWPTRGPRASDEALVARAVAAWTTSAVTVPGTRGGPPEGVPRVLFAGTVDAVTVVLLLDAARLARYTEPASGPASGPAAGRVRLDLQAADESDSRSASAIALAGGPDGTRFLLAPWVTSAAVRDLTAPSRPPVALPVQGWVTAPVRAAAPGACGSVPVLELRSPQAADEHPYLLADLGDPAPAHLTWMPPPPAALTGRPHEATGERALAVWGASACRLTALRAQGVRLVNAWQLADVDLPDGGGAAAWVCLRSYDRAGGGTAATALVRPGVDRGDAVFTPRPEPLACTRRGHDVVTAAWWRSAAGHRYLIAAGSRDVVRLTAGVPVAAGAEGRVLIAPAPAAVPEGAPPPPVTGRLADGGTVTYGG